MSTIHYTVTGMTCGHCEAAVREEVEALDGVAVVEVDREKNSLIIDVADAVEVDDAAVIAAVDEAGYVAVRA